MVLGLTSLRLGVIDAYSNILTKISIVSSTHRFRKYHLLPEIFALFDKYLQYKNTKNIIIRKKIRKLFGQKVAFTKGFQRIYVYF